MRLFKPSVFQGNLKKKNYFEGWYFKQVTKDMPHTYSIIPGVSLADDDPHAFIQIMDGQFFTGLISFLYLDNKFYLFGTYNGSEFSEVSNNNELLDITLKNRHYKLKVRVLKNSFCDLAAPVSGEMSRRIKESIDSELQIQLFNKSDEPVYAGTGRNVGLEIIEEIFRYV